MTIVKQGNMTALDWGKTTEERNKNIEIYNKEHRYKQLKEKLRKIVYRIQKNG